MYRGSGTDQNMIFFVEDTIEIIYFLFLSLFSYGILKQAQSYCNWRNPVLNVPFTLVYWNIRNATNPINKLLRGQTEKIDGAPSNLNSRISGFRRNAQR